MFDSRLLHFATVVRSVAPIFRNQLKPSFPFLKSLMVKPGVFTLSLLLGSLAASAQTHTARPVAGAGRVIRVDTIVLPPRESRPPQAPAALATTVTPAAAAAFAGRYKPVPLAGTKNYYGKMGPYVNSFVRTYLSAHTRTLSTVKARSAKRFKQMDAVLSKYQIPRELKYLAVIESACNNQAVSCAGAVGPWQLMEGTARDLGLTVNEQRDDRTDWNRSTNAAAKYLRSLYGQLNDWLLVVAAYNSGPVPVQRAIQKTGSRSFWDIKKHLPRETQGHVMAFIATASIFEKMSPYIASGKLPSDFKFGDEEVGLVAKTADTVAPPKPRFTPEELARMAIVRLTEPVSLDYMAQELHMDRKELGRWNPDYDLFVYNSYTEPYYALRIPKDKVDGFIERKDQLIRVSKTIFGEETAFN